jgi:CheY-like chemotaxis protein
LRALVVDDSRTIRQILRAMLEDAGFRVDEAADADDALAAIESGPLPDVALIDWHMPGRSGLELIRVLRDDPRTRDVRMLIVTRYGSAEARAAALEGGADAILEKPFSARALHERIGSLAPAARP